MKVIAAFFVVILVVAGGAFFYKPHQAFVQHQPSGGAAEVSYTKCITKDGRVFYGTVPSGVVCKQQPVSNSLTVVPAQKNSSASSFSPMRLKKIAVNPRAEDYQCDGRTQCSQMRSCEEAKFFLSHCPGATMDGNNDGVPCERQWCR